MNQVVSVIVVTYNSSSYVEETLDSVCNQSWANIELIITDDCSKDHTVDICKAWVEKNKSRFAKAVIVEAETNSGVPANLNRGLKEVTGEWICFPAGDDTIKPLCIEDNMGYIEAHPEIQVLLSEVDVYKNTFIEENYLRTIKANEGSADNIMYVGRTAESQYKMLLISDRIDYTPSLFINKVVLFSLGGFDERFKLLEDYPLWLNLTKNGHRLYFFNKPTVNYRMHVDAINNKGDNIVVNPNYFMLEKFRRIYTYPNLPFDIKLNQRYTWYALQPFKLNFMNKKNGINYFIMLLLKYYLNPFWYFVRIKKRINIRNIDSEYYL